VAQDDVAQDDVTQDDGSDWADYYAWSAGREPRPMLLAACQELGAGQGRMAVDLGCGDGTDALELLARGWSVTAVDATEAGLELPRAHLIHAGMTFHARPEIDGLLDGLEILRLDETEEDGHAADGPKHWHIFDILARHHAPVAPAR